MAAAALDRWDSGGMFSLRDDGVDVKSRGRRKFKRGENALEKTKHKKTNQPPRPWHRKYHRTAQTTEKVYLVVCIILPYE